VCRSWHRPCRTTIRPGMRQPPGLAPEMAMASELVTVTVTAMVMARAKASLRSRKRPCPPTVPIAPRLAYCSGSTICSGTPVRCS
jgi:hypothetical protein